MFRTIASRLIFWFLVISLVPCGVLTILLSWTSTQSTRDLVRRHLMALSEAKANELETLAVERLRNATALARAPNMVEAAVFLTEVKCHGLDRPDAAAREQLSRVFLNGFCESFGYPNAYLFSPDGVLLLALREGLDVGKSLPAGPLRETELAAVVDRAKTLLQTELSDFAQYPGQPRPAAYIASPVLKEGAVLGVVALELNSDQVFQVFANYSGLGQTGETLVGSRVGDEVVVVAPLRHNPDAAFKHRVKMGDTRSLPLQRAVRGQRGYGTEPDYRGEDCAAVWTYLPSFRWGMVVKQNASEAFRLITRQRWVIGLSLGLTVALVLVVALVVARSISRPIQEAVQVTQHVAEGDLTTRLAVTATGETGQLLGAIQKMIDYLRSLIGKIQVSSVTLMSTATEIAATSRQQEQTMNEYGASTSQAAAAVKQISATSQELLRTMNDVSAVASQTGDKAAAGQASLASMERSMQQLVNATGSINSKLSVISERARNITLVVTTITKVADQTNLLSINAAIEAEKAGEYGRGFLVVAREIRRLADQTAVATLDIERMVKEMQQSVSAGVMEMDKFSEQVRQGGEEVARLSSQMGEIIIAVQSLISRFEQVNDGMRAQSQGADQIREAMVRLSEGANQTARSLCEFNQATAQLREAVGSLKEDVSWFTVGHVEAPLGDGNGVVAAGPRPGRVLPRERDSCALPGPTASEHDLAVPPLELHRRGDGRRLPGEP